MSKFKPCFTKQIKLHLTKMRFIVREYIPVCINFTLDIYNQHNKSSPVCVCVHIAKGWVNLNHSIISQTSHSLYGSWQCNTCTTLHGIEPEPLGIVVGHFISVTCKMVDSKWWIFLFSDIQISEMDFNLCATLHTLYNIMKRMSKMLWKPLYMVTL